MCFKKHYIVRDFHVLWWLGFGIFRRRPVTVVCVGFFILNAFLFLILLKKSSTPAQVCHDVEFSPFPPPSPPLTWLDKLSERTGQKSSSSLAKNEFKIMTTTKPRSPRFKWTSRVTCDDDEEGSRKKENLNGIAIIVHSARANFNQRRQIRETWGGVRSYLNWTVLTLAFMLGGQGQEGEESWVSEIMEIEQDTYGDLVTRDFVDSYRNLTLKAIMAFEWLAEFCPKTQIVVKVDDDVVINIFGLVKNLQKIPAIAAAAAAQSKFHCIVMGKSVPSRHKSNKWYVSPEEYPYENFPPYCGGPAWLAPMRVVEKILMSVHSLNGRAKFFWIDDIFVTGIMPADFNSRLRLLNQNGSRHPGNDGDGKGFIGHVDRKKDWFFSPANFQSSTKDLKIWLADLSKNASEKEKVDKWRIEKQFGSKIFFVIDHGPNFANQFLASWQKIKSLNGFQ